MVVEDTGIATVVAEVVTGMVTAMVVIITNICHHTKTVNHEMPPQTLTRHHQSLVNLKFNNHRVLK